MKKLIILGVFALGGLALSNAQTMTFTNIKDNTLDYGKVEKGTNKEKFVKIKNTGKEPLIISQATGSCGCTVPEWPKTPILPGKTANLKITYDTNRVGQFTKTVTITSNDTKNPSTVVKVTGDVKETAVAEKK